ncbi:MAG: hypothetical protein VYA08_05240, partial [Pseudomonadota bacterium]|nr:hypothetical protein [Pseudomonadota bacterium]
MPGTPIEDLLSKSDYFRWANTAIAGLCGTALYISICVVAAQVMHCGFSRDAFTISSLIRSRVSSAMHGRCALLHYALH